MSDENPQDDKKITRTVDKIVMGLIIGGAVGSVLGMAFAPKSGKETRKLIKKKAGELSENIKEKAGEMKEEIAHTYEEKKDESKSFFSHLTEKFGLKKEKKSGAREKKIPSEQDL